MQHKNLTVIIASIGARNPHMAPFLVSIQQLYYSYTYNVANV